MSVKDGHDLNPLDVPNALSVAPEPYSIFDRRQKGFIVFLVSIAATFSTLASNIYFPALLAIAHDLNISVQLVTLSITSYLVFQGVAPSLWGPVSDVKGRRTAYAFTFLVSIGASVGLAETKNFATLIIVRCLQSTGSASTIAIGAGVIGDITTRSDRGGYMGIFQAGLLTPIAVGPVIGGALAGSLGWRAIFWFLTIYSGILLSLLLLLFPETLRSVVSNGSRTPRNCFARYPLILYQRSTKVEWDSKAVPPVPARKHIDVLGPLRILTKKYAFPIIMFFSIYFTVWQMSITAMSSLFKSRYGLSELHLGLTFIANGVGSMIGTLVSGKLLDMDYRAVQSKSEKRRNSAVGEVENCGASNAFSISGDAFPLEKARLRLIPVYLILQCVSLLLFGWTVQYSDHVHIAVPIASTFITGWSVVSIQNTVTTYLVDMFPDRSAAATASLNLARCLLGAGGISFVVPMTDKVGAGLAFTICVVVQVVAVIGLIVQWRYAGRWRQCEKS